MLANYILIRCVNPCPPVFIRIGISIQRQVDSQLDKTRPEALETWSDPIFSEQDQIAKSRASIQQADRKKLTAPVLMDFVLIATLCLNPWAASITFAPVKKEVHLSLKKIFNVAVIKELDELI